MISYPTRAGKPGFVSYFMVLSTGMILTLLMVYTYRRAINSMEVQSAVQMRVDYGEREDAILRSIVALTPNRTIRAMQHNSAATTNAAQLTWKQIFSDALVQSNARNSLPENLRNTLNVANLRLSNTGDSTTALQLDSVFEEIPPPPANAKTPEIFMTSGTSAMTGYPPPLDSSSSTKAKDLLYPIISTNSAGSASTNDKTYGATAQTALNSASLNGNGTAGYGVPVNTYPVFNRLRYPQINFGYARPGDPFVAKRNWWAFSMNLAGHDAGLTRLANRKRDFVLSIYEIPSQLAISADSFMSLGRLESGEAWQNINIQGGIFAGRAIVEGETTLPALASRRSMTLSDDAVIGDPDQILTNTNNPFAPGVRESHQITTGEFFPVSLASESGRVAFVPINRGAEFFDRFHPNVVSEESGTLSPSTWNKYSVGALQCAMRLDITKVESATNKTVTEYKFSYFKGGVRKTDVISSKPATTGAKKNLPGGYLYAAAEDQTYDFGTAVVDVAYGLNGYWAYQTGVTGSVTFNNDRFGDPLVGTRKSGYFRPSYLFEKSELPSGKPCIAIYPQRLPALLASLNADPVNHATTPNNSLVVNVDYTNIGATYPLQQKIPCTDEIGQYGLILQECADLSAFTRGFSLVTNLRTYIGDDFNVVPGTPPTGYTPGGTYYPPASLFAPEKRYGVDVDPFAVSLGGQVGSLAKGDKVVSSDDDPSAVRPMDSKTMSGSALGANRITVNLRPITHPAELPPITMMNWLLVLEERRNEFIGN
ncbi:MAG: hypothetical protein Q8Q59_10305 [Luteolibacter sp.]|jgi:hypothetical protein|nr:hypothetical protein [Luteolibacter sp.]